MIENPKLSIIIPIYNAQTYLNECLNSIYNQTFKDFEVLLIDDGSTDNSKHIIETFTKKDSRFKYIYKDNSGVSATRNLGIEKSTGKYVTFVDSDDWLDDCMYSEMIDKITNTNSEIALCSYVREYPHLNEQKKEILPFKDKTLFKDNEVRDIVLYEMLGKKALHNTSIMGSVWRLVISRDFIINNDLKFREDTVIGEDLLFCIYALGVCNRLCIVNKHFYHYRFTQNSAMTKYRPNQWDIGYGFNKKFRNALNNLSFSDLDELIAFDLIRAALCSCEMICKNENKDSFFNKLKSISNICKTKDLETFINKIDFNKISSKDKLKINFLKYKQSLAIYLFYTLKDKKQ